MNIKYILIVKSDKHLQVLPVSNVCVCLTKWLL